MLYGDVNLDGVVSVRDKTLVNKYVAGVIELTSEQLVAGDVNGDGCVDDEDATLISQYSMGLINCFPVEN